MPTKKRKQRKGYKRLPPHSWEAHHITNHGEVKKPLVIAIITVALLIGVVSLLLLSDTFVGKAVFVEDSKIPLNAGGVFYTDNEAFFLPGDESIVTVRANIGSKKTVAVGFTLDLTGSLTCDDLLGVYDKTGWKVLAWDKYECKDLGSKHQITFEKGTLNYLQAKTGVFEIAEIEFYTGDAGEDVMFNFDSLVVYELGTADDILTTKQNVEVFFKDPSSDKKPDDKKPDVCTDSDGGVDLSKKGTVTGLDNTGKQVTKVDECYDKVSKQGIIDYICKQDGKTVSGYPADCPETHVCKDGACVKSGIGFPIIPIADLGFTIIPHDIKANLEVGEPKRFSANGYKYVISTTIVSGGDNAWKAGSVILDGRSVGPLLPGEVFNMSGGTRVQVIKVTHRGDPTVNMVEFVVKTPPAKTPSITSTPLVTVTEINSTHTKVTANEKITTPFSVAITIKGKNSSLQLFKLETIQNMTKDESKTIVTSQNGNLTVSKNVVVYDVPSPKKWKVYLKEKFKKGYSKK